MLRNVILCASILVLLGLGLHTEAQHKEAIATHNWTGTTYQIAKTDSFYYDLTGNLTGMTIFNAVHSGSNTVFVEQDIITCINDVQGRRMEEFLTRLVGSGYDTIWKINYQYFPNGKLRLMDENRRDINTGNWSASPTKTFYAYTATGQIDSVIRYIANAGTWGLASLQKHHYLTNGKLSEIRTFVLVNGILTYLARTAYTYDGQDRLDLIEIFEGPNDPVLRETRDYFYSTGSTLADSLIITNLRPSTPTSEKLTYQYLPNDSVVDTYRYIKHLGQWFPQQWFKITYRTLSLQVYEPGILQSKVFPNPVSNYLHIKLDEQGSVVYTLRSLSGQLIEQAVCSIGETHLNLGHLAPGIYSLELSSGGRSAVHKIVKQ